MDGKEEGGKEEKKKSNEEKAGKWKENGENENMELNDDGQRQKQTSSYIKYCLTWRIPREHSWLV